MAKKFLKDDNWRIFEVVWIPSNQSEIKKKKAKEFIEKVQKSDLPRFMDTMSVNKRELTFRVMAIKYKDENLSSERL